MTKVVIGDRQKSDKVSQKYLPPDDQRREKNCDFKSYAGKEDLIDNYIKWLKYELKEVGEGNRADYENRLDDLAIVKTIYIGGGTPSVIGAKYIEEILEVAKENYTLPEDVEITIEVNI